MANEGTPLLGGGLLAEKLTESGFAFRRSVAMKKHKDNKGRRESSRTLTSRALFDDTRHVQPVDGLSPLVTGGVITTTDGYKTQKRPASVVKSLPAFVPFRRKARHRNFYLWWINEFRHWWKSSRLLVRLAGLFTLAFTGVFLLRMIHITVYFPIPDWPKKGKRKAKKAFHKMIRKNTKQAVKVVKKLGQGGPMRGFTKFVKPFTRTIRILVAAWRWQEAAQCRRGEVGTEEAFAFMGNRVSRMLARLIVDGAVAYIIMPVAYEMFQWEWLAVREGMDDDWWHPVTLFIVLGVIRACAPYGASFQGSRAGRVLTRTFFKALYHRWQPIQAVEQLNLTSDDAQEEDEASQTADLVRIGKIVAGAFGMAKDIGTDGMAEQKGYLLKEGFRQVGAGSGGYAVYECHRRVWSKGEEDQDQKMSILLHVTPYGPSILDVMPRYIVLEFEDSVDRRAKWSEFITKNMFEGPPVVEGYCYGGAFFSPHHFAELKATYDKQLQAYDLGCQSLCKPRTVQQTPPSDLASLKAFLANGKPGKKKRRNERQMKELQKSVHGVADELKRMMKNPCHAPRGVILYFEGLDCAGKSSTGGLVEQALVEAGFNVGMCQYNRPPTEAQKQRPWMDRFEVPNVTTMDLTLPEGAVDENPKPLTSPACADHPHNALVWDRGPSGDFVYNPTYRAMPLDERKDRYQEFMDFDQDCFKKKILFFKLLFVTNRDSIASTLGKRLAQKKMARDLRTWLGASTGTDTSADDEDLFEGLQAIELHLDPTDFVAFNSYQTNLRIFTNFARNTDSNENPWVVVNTSDRYNARKALMRAFRKKLERFKEPGCCGDPDKSRHTPRQPTPISQDEMMDIGSVRPWPIQLLVALMGLFLVAFYYAENTTFGNPFRDSFINIEDLLPKDDDDMGNATTSVVDSVADLLFPWFDF